MDGLSNAFSVLELDADDSQVKTPAAASSSSSSSSSCKSVESKSKANSSSNLTLENQQNSQTPLEFEYKMPLVWIDLEMTGLNIEVDRILEIACIITDGKLTKSVEGPDLVIHQTKECLDSMGEWCQNHHEASDASKLTAGLTKKVLHSGLTEREAEKQLTRSRSLLPNQCRWSLSSSSSDIKKQQQQCDPIATVAVTDDDVDVDNDADYVDDADDANDVDGDADNDCFDFLIVIRDIIIFPPKEF
ncbi:Oligoribonuclease [Citrus sinensis]|uniref:Oligoribonuclease n=1 Tax=Citrus sinensis TaxID=2711 RepID=A0ACB8MXU9_CITSI|nr:Oligoribonuclease [Citrus sinensis]